MAAFFPTEFCQAAGTRRSWTSLRRTREPITTWSRDMDLVTNRSTDGSLSDAWIRCRKACGQVSYCCGEPPGGG
jgi:hypothetical protein